MPEATMYGFQKMKAPDCSQRQLNVFYFIFLFFYLTLFYFF